MRIGAKPMWTQGGSMWGQIGPAKKWTSPRTMGYARQMNEAAASAQKQAIGQFANAFFGHVVNAGFGRVELTFKVAAERTAGEFEAKLAEMRTRRLDLTV